MDQQGVSSSKTAKLASIFTAVAFVGVGLTACSSSLESQTTTIESDRQAGASDLAEQLNSQKVTKIDGDIDPSSAQTVMRLEQERKVLGQASQSLYNQLGTFDESKYNIDSPIPRSYKNLAYYQRLAEKRPEIRNLVDQLAVVEKKIQKIDQQINSTIGFSEH